MIGSTFIVAVVSSEIVSPYPDKAVEGILQFFADISPTIEARGGVRILSADIPMPYYHKIKVFVNGYVIFRYPIPI